MFINLDKAPPSEKKIKLISVIIKVARLSQILVFCFLCVEAFGRIEAAAGSNPNFLHYLAALTVTIIPLLTIFFGFRALLVPTWAKSHELSKLDTKLTKNRRFHPDEVERRYRYIAKVSEQGRALSSTEFDVLYFWRIPHNPEKEKRAKEIEDAREAQRISQKMNDMAKKAKCDD